MCECMQVIWHNNIKSFGLTLAEVQVSDECVDHDVCDNFKKEKCSADDAVVELCPMLCDQCPEDTGENPTW